VFLSLCSTPSNIFNAMQCFVHVLISLLTVVFHCCFKQQYSIVSLDKPGTSDATDTDVNKGDVLRRPRKIIYNMYTFLKKLSSDYEHAKTDLLKTH
jgi:hypothetical protein